MLNDINGLIEKIFKELNYENTNFSIVDDQDELLNKSIFAKNPLKKNYYIVLFLEDENFLNKILENQARYFYLLKEFFGEDPNIEKNTSLLVLLNSRRVSDNLVLKLEEDPYYFRKYLLQYSDDEVNDLFKTHLAEIKAKGVVKVMEEIINNIELFETFKKNPDDNSIYNLIATIFIKLSIIRMNVEDKKVTSLRTMINDSLEQRNLIDLKVKIDKLKLNYSEINDDFLDELINLYVDKE